MTGIWFGALYLVSLWIDTTLLFQKRKKESVLTVRTCRYKPSEHASRHGIWFLGNSFGGLGGSLMAYGVNHIQSRLATWRVCFHSVHIKMILSVLTRILHIVALHHFRNYDITVGPRAALLSP
jgi:hypothetical protein